MAKILMCACLCVVASGMTGCAASGYWASRRADLTDVAHVDGHVLSMGLAANAGPAIVGCHVVFNLPVISDDLSGEVGRVGFGGCQTRTSKGAAVGVVIPLSWGQEKGRPGAYGRTRPSWGSVGFDAGFWGGLGAHVDIVELADFILGWTTSDILGDDLEAVRKAPASTKGPEASGQSALQP